jgi:hypothetical protein
MLISVGVVWRFKAPQTPQRLTVISSSPPTNMEDTNTMGNLRVVTKPVTKLEAIPTN